MCAAAEPEAAPDLPPLPAPVTVRDTAFVEFAAQGEGLAALEALLASLGFRRTGRHVSKKVALWQQGAIRIVLNAEETGHAASAWAARGTTVCDIGLTVTSAPDTVGRANALGARPFSQPLGPGELPIPAIRGLGGSVLHFIDAGALAEVWDVEFLPEANQGRDAGLTRIDHIAQTMTYDEMLSWSLFYTTLFDMQKAPMVDVIDPDGLVRSRAIATPEGGFRITLNGAETHRTLAGSFLAEGFGATVQHIALATNDIFAAAEVLRERGFAALPISPNYFDDLAARFDLAPGVLERLRAANILYDADGEGEFFPALFRAIRGADVHRDRRAAGRLCGLRRRQRALPDRRPQAAAEAKGAAPDLTPRAVPAPTTEKHANPAEHRRRRQMGGNQ